MLQRSTVSTSIAFIREGKVRAVAGFPAKQIPELADTPPASQAVPGFSIDLWHGIVAPAGMDPALVSQINAIFNKVIETPAVARPSPRPKPPRSSAALPSSSTT